MGNSDSCQHIVDLHLKRARDCFIPNGGVLPVNNIFRPALRFLCMIYADRYKRGIKLSEQQLARVLNDGRTLGYSCIIPKGCYTEGGMLECCNFLLRTVPTLANGRVPSGSLLMNDL